MASCAANIGEDDDFFKKNNFLFYYGRFYKVRFYHFFIDVI